MLDPRRLLTFREVARRGSFSRAAEALALTQPAVSQQVAALEREGGAPLLGRRGRARGRAAAAPPPPRRPPPRRAGRAAARPRGRPLRPADRGRRAARR